MERLDQVSPTNSLVWTGFSLIAVSYGFARFAFGLFLPEIETDLSLSSTLSGLISGGSFLGYCIAIVFSARLTEQAGPRAVAIGTGVIAAVGMLGIAAAPSAVWLAGAVIIAGTSTGLASPPMASAVALAFQPERQGQANTIINSGTAAGVVISGPIALAIAGHWRLAFVLFAGAAVAVAIAASYSIPVNKQPTTASATSIPTFNLALARLTGAALLMGIASTAIWSFGSDLVIDHLDWNQATVGILWVTIGVAGLLGALAGTLVAKFGITKVHWVFLGILGLSILLVGASQTTAVLALMGGALFGLAYIMLCGVYLVWGVAVLADRPAMGLMIGFLSVAVGQTAGAPLFGLLLDHFSADLAVSLFAGIAVTAGLTRVSWRAILAKSPAK